jgi:hypothetical protein
MKFVNKLSVISLIVLMFSFMNIATAAPACKGTSVNPCSKIKVQSQCANYYSPHGDGTGTQCIWDGNCVTGGAACGGNPTITCPAGYTAVNGKCYEDANESKK